MNRKGKKQEPWAELDKLRGPATFREKPEGSFTAKEYAERYGVTSKRALDSLVELIQAGHVEFLGKLGIHRENLYRLAEGK